MDAIMMAGLVRIDLPAIGATPAKTIRLTSGGLVTWGAESFTAQDAVFGMIAKFDEIEEGGGNSAPTGQLTMLPATNAAAIALSQPGYQMAPVRFWSVEVDPVSGATVDANAELLGDMLIDTTELSSGKGARTLSIGLISAGDRLMSINEGNTFSHRFHQTIFPGELGFANAVEITGTRAWRVTSPPRGSVNGGGGGGGGGKGFEYERAVEW